MSETTHLSPTDKPKIDFASLQKTIIRDINNNLTISNGVLRKYSKEEVAGFLDNPSRYEKQLRDISIYLYNASSHYKRLIKYFASLPTLDYTVHSINSTTKKINKKSYETAYKNVLNILDKMNIKHEFGKILVDVMKEDVYFGYVHELPDSFYIQKLDSQNCQITSIEDGVYNFSFNFGSVAEKNLGLYPKEIQKKYNKYKADRKLQWQELDSANTICIKFHEENTYVTPPFVGVFESILDINLYKELKKAKTSIENYKLIGLEIPLLKDNEVDDMALSIDTVSKFVSFINSSLPEGIGSFVSPMPFEAIDFKESNTAANKVEEAIQEFWDNSGTNQLLFNSKNSTGASLAMSVDCDAGMMYGVLNQIGRWINRRLKNYNNDSFKFAVKFLEVNIYNRDKVFQRYYQLSVYGMPVLHELLASTGLTPSQVINNNFLELDVLGLVNKFLPPSSANTMSGASSDTGGRPQKDDTDITDSGEASRTNDSNNSDNRT